MIISLDIKTGEVIGVRDSSERPFEELADSFARSTLKIWKEQIANGKLGTGNGEGGKA